MVAIIETRGLTKQYGRLTAVKELDLTVWGAASDVEYATFLMSIGRGIREDSWKKNLKKSGDVKSALLSAHDLLRESVEALDSDSEEAYRKAWIARGRLLEAQNKLAKGRSKG